MSPCDNSPLRELAAEELGDWARTAPFREVWEALIVHSRRTARWRLIGPKAQPAAELQGTARVNEMPVDGGGEIAW